jgi:hypothetical protein
MKKRQKKKHCHGLTRNFTEKTEAETRKEEHIIRSQMRERRYKYTVWGGPFGRLRDRGSFATVSELVELADISCTRVKDTARVINAKTGTPHTRS